MEIKKEGDGTHVLLVDDDAVSLHSSAAILKIGGYAVTAVNSGKAALEEISRQQDCSLVILDVMMPEMSGYEVCRRIRENKSGSNAQGRGRTLQFSSSRPSKASRLKNRSRSPLGKK